MNVKLARPALTLLITPRRRAAAIWLGLMLGTTSCLAFADCYDDAAQFHQVNPWVLRAIAARESGFRPATIARNRNGTEDIGQFGTNSVHLPELARYGISKGDLLDGCKSTYVAGWRLAKMVRKYGNTWTAVGAYHSETPFYRDLYARAVRQLIEFWQSQGLLRP